MLSYYNILIKLKKFMSKIKIYLLILFLTFSHNSLLACDLLGIGIGEDKSTVKNLFGELPESQYVKDQNDVIKFNLVKKYTDQPISFCDDMNVFGNVLMSVYIVDNKVGAFELEVTGPLISKNGDLIKANALNQYVQSNFGEIDTEDKNWPGYKFWNIGNKQIYYYKMKKISNITKEGVVVTSPKYFEVLLANEDVDEVPN